MPKRLGTQRRSRLGLQAISQKVAAASAEGGFLGTGGVQVTDAEKATLADISKALATSA